MSTLQYTLKMFNDEEGPLVTQSRRSPVMSLKGVVSSSQPLATQIGVEILAQGGNAADATIAVAAALCVTEPMNTSVGGDAFCLYYDAKTKEVEGLNASGRTSRHLTREKVLGDLGVEAEEKAPRDLPVYHPHTVSVPGSVAGWVDTLEKWGSMKLEQVLAPAIQLAEEGFPVGPVTAFNWNSKTALETQLPSTPGGKELLNADGKPPESGEIFKSPTYAKTLRLIAKHGKDGFYKGEVADSIIKTVQDLGSVLDHEDLESHKSEMVTPLSVNYKGVDVWQIPPSGQGIICLIALNILKGFDLKSMGHNSPQYLHTLIEALRLAFLDGRWFVSDLQHTDIDPLAYLSEEYAAERRKLINPEKATVDIKKGNPIAKSDTVSFCVVDSDGNSCSFIQSLYTSFGSGFVPEGTGFALQNRAGGFTLDENHPNVIAPSKRPYHTIIPGMATKNGELYCPFTVMGGFNQPQGHTQIMLNMIEFGMNAQEALDASRFSIKGGIPDGEIAIESDVGKETIDELIKMGHNMASVSDQARSIVGRGQIIRKLDNGVLVGGSDGRCDGCAYPVL